MFKTICVTLLLLPFHFLASGQSGAGPEIGKQMPDFHLGHVLTYNTEASYKDYKDKWLFMYFWYSGCSASIKKLAEVDHYRKAFSDRMEFLMIGVNGREMFWGDGLEDMYTKLAQKQNLSTPIAFDSLLAMKWGIYAMPHIIIVDPKGLVRVVTNGQDMTQDKISNLLEGKPVTFYKEVKRPHFDASSLFCESQAGDRLLMHQSVLAKWNGERNFTPDISYYLEYEQQPIYRASMIPLFQLYNLAYLGMAQWIRVDSLYSRVYPTPILEVKDSSLFSFDYNAGTGLYNYFLKTRSNSTARDLMQALQRDLNTTFGYTASIEDREVPVWALVATAEGRAKLPTKGGRHFYSDFTASGGVGGFTFRNERMFMFISNITRYIDDGSVPYLDETGITSNIDIHMDALMTDLQQIKKELQKNGLDLIKTTKTMKAIVIKDATERVP